MNHIQFQQEKISGDTLDIIQYTEEIYFNLFPRNTHGDYLTELDADEVTLLEQWEKKHDKKAKKVRRVIVDERYLYWLGKKKKKDNVLNRQLYMAQISDEEVVGMWEEEFGTHIVESHFIPVTLMANSDFYMSSVVPIPEGPLKEFKDGLVKLWESNGVKEEDVVIIPEMMDAALYGVQEERLILQTFEYLFADGEFPVPTVYQKGPRKPANLGMRYIPVFLKRENKAILERDELEKEYISSELPEELSEKLMSGIKQEEGMSDYDFVGNNLLLPAFEYENYHNDFTRVAEEMMKDKKKE